MFLNTNNWPVSDLTYEARMMAGKAAMARFSYKDAVSYFTNLWTTNCPLALRVQATFGYADAMISQDSTNKTADLNEAIGSLQTIVQSRPNSREAALAWGIIGNCHFDLGAKDPSHYAAAISNYTRVINAPAALRDDRYEARFKLAATIEKQAALKTGDEQTALLQEALREYVDSLFQNLNDPEKPSPFWIKRSALQAGQLAESLQRWKDAVDIYTDLKNLLPVLAPLCDRRIIKANEHLSLPAAAPASSSPPPH